MIMIRRYVASGSRALLFTEKLFTFLEHSLMRSSEQNRGNFSERILTSDLMSRF